MAMAFNALAASEVSLTKHFSPIVCRTTTLQILGT